jgi:tRNA(fMet)-specific endonuclease VapC
MARMTRYLLDTNIVSHLIRQHPEVVQQVRAAPITSLCISAITHGELLFGVAKRPDAVRLRLAVGEFLKRVDVLPWGSATAQSYGPLRADMAQQGLSLSALDLLIAAHALDAGAVLVTNDRAFSRIAQLRVEDWTV